MSHSRLGASVASRWMACPGSVNLIAGLPENEQDRSGTSEYAQEGTRAHTAAAALLEGQSPETVDVDDDMLEAVTVYVDHCRDLMGLIDDHRKVEFWIEHRFDLAELHPPIPMYGTADFVLYDHGRCALHVVDFKYGQGVPVEVAGNKQLRYYALGAALTIGAGLPITDVVMTIIQPRAPHKDGPIRTETIEYLELIEFAGELLRGARATLSADAALVPGGHCRFCPAAGVCPAQRDMAQSVAMVEFAAPLPVPRSPETLTVSELSNVMALLPLLDDWAGAVRQRVYDSLSAGVDVPGFKLVAKRANRQWSDERAAQQYLFSAAFDPDDWQVSKMKSPAQIEKLIGKKAFEHNLSGLTEKHSSGYSVVDVNDPRPAAALEPAADFILIEGKTEEEI